MKPMDDFGSEQQLTPSHSVQTHALKLEDPVKGLTCGRTHLLIDIDCPLISKESRHNVRLLNISTEMIITECEDSRLKTFSRETYKHVVLVLFCL